MLKNFECVILHYVLKQYMMFLGPPLRSQFHSSRHPSSNNSDSNNRESSLDDSGVVDDHEEGDVTSEDVAHIPNVVQVCTGYFSLAVLCLDTEEIMYSILV